MSSGHGRGAGSLVFVGVTEVLTADTEGSDDGAAEDAGTTA
jgi:hypothetical protein